MHLCQFFGFDIVTLLNKTEKLHLYSRKTKLLVPKTWRKRNWKIQNRRVFMKNIMNCSMDQPVVVEIESKILAIISKINECSFHYETFIHNLCLCNIGIYI